ncbi:hypothetical protein L596_006006 [Steinernema carpocapsae]|uniref:Uncharacterized protein n=1 Tax=Steinernema carpocapsae TaxID=34508 RepID=A0A4V6I8V2_STECR|nr:hypothetical protein L596_006006 [Steinernema carpocapsae]
MSPASNIPVLKNSRDPPKDSTPQVSGNTQTPSTYRSCGSCVDSSAEQLGANCAPAKEEQNRLEEEASRKRGQQMQKDRRKLMHRRRNRWST